MTGVAPSQSGRRNQRETIRKKETVKAKKIRRHAADFSSWPYCGGGGGGMPGGGGGIAYVVEGAGAGADGWVV
jgi:hypothetical protein